MGMKSRGNWNINFCIKQSSCENKNKKCSSCIKFSLYNTNVGEQTQQPTTKNKD